MRIVLDMDASHSTATPAATELATYHAAQQAERTRLAAIAAIPCAVVSTDWPGVATIAGCSGTVTTTAPGTADLIIAGRSLTVALAWDADEGAPYVTDYGDATTLDEAERIDGAIVTAWAMREVA